MLGTKILEVVWEEMGECSIFSCFSVKLAVVDRFSRAVVVVEGAVEFVEVTDSVGEEKMGTFGAISPVEPNFAFFLFSESARERDVATQVGQPISRCWDVPVSVWVPVVVNEVVAMDIVCVSREAVVFGSVWVATVEK
jgi:hypothetical protein